MNPERVSQRGLRFSSAQAAHLENFCLVFDKVSAAHPGQAHANIRWSPGERVEGVLYELADAAEILKMDPFEKSPINYGRDAVQVEVANGERRWTWTYFANPAVLGDGLAPSTEYMSHLLAGAQFLTTPYLKMLQNHPCSDA